MSRQDEAPVGLETGPTVIAPDVVAMVLFSAPEKREDGFGISAEVRARAGMSPALLIGALRAHADALEEEFGDVCVCGESHG